MRADEGKGGFRLCAIETDLFEVEVGVGPELDPIDSGLDAKEGGVQISQLMPTG